MTFKRPSLAEIEQFITDDLGIPRHSYNWYELIPVNGKFGFEFYMIAIFTRHDDQDFSDETVSIACYWPQTQKALPSPTRGTTELQDYT